MSGNRSLDEFAGAGGAEEDGVAAAEERPPDGAAGEPDGAGVTDASTSDSPPDTDPDSDSDLDPNDGAPESDDDAVDSAGSAADGEPVEPPASTYRWSPDGAACAACDATVEERWRDGDDLVCAGCKEW